MWSETVGLRTRPVSGLVSCCETRSCYARRRNDLEGHSNFSSTIYSFSILCLEHHYCGDQQWRSLTYNLNLPGAFVYFRWSWSCYFGLGLKNLVLFTSLSKRFQNLMHRRLDKTNADVPMRRQILCFMDHEAKNLERQPRSIYFISR